MARSLSCSLALELKIEEISSSASALSAMLALSSLDRPLENFTEEHLRSMEGVGLELRLSPLALCGSEGDGEREGEDDETGAATGLGTREGEEDEAAGVGVLLRDVEALLWRPLRGGERSGPRPSPVASTAWGSLTCSGPSSARHLVISSSMPSSVSLLASGLKSLEALKSKDLDLKIFEMRLPPADELRLVEDTDLW